uniref:PIR2-like helical domain-containing protein n=1 Tax=Oryza meridionalis TaxID=40149 RepID=A0A0E0E092_9ORYZ
MILKRETTMASRSRVKRASGEMVLSKIVAGVDVPYPPEARTVAERSLEGLITFLTSYYRNLPTWDSSACPWRISSSPSASSREFRPPSSPPLDSRCDQVIQIDAEATGSEELEQSYGSCCYEMPSIQYEGSAYTDSITPGHSSGQNPWCSQSLDGLINVLVARVSGLSEHDALVYLLKSNLDLTQAIQMAG